MGVLVSKERTAAALDEAERAARAIADGAEERPVRFSGLAAGLAPSDPARAAGLWDEAERAAQGLTDTHKRCMSLAKVASSAVRGDADRAERISMQMLDSGWTGPVYHSGLVAAFVLDPDGIPRARRGSPQASTIR